MKLRDAQGVIFLGFLFLAINIIALLSFKMMNVSQYKESVSYICYSNGQVEYKGIGYNILKIRDGEWELLDRHGEKITIEGDCFFGE